MYQAGHWALDICDPIYPTQKPSQVATAIPIFQRRKLRLGDLSKFTQLVSDRSEIWAQVCLAPELQSHSQNILLIPEYPSLNGGHESA